MGPVLEGRSLQITEYFEHWLKAVLTQKSCKVCSSCLHFECNGLSLLTPTGADKIK